MRVAPSSASSDGLGLDIYGLTRCRDGATIHRFLADWIDYGACEDRGDEELMLVPLGGPEEPGWDGWEWEPARTLTHIVRRGLDSPRRAFRTYLRSNRPPARDVYLFFTVDDLLILGLSISDDEQPGTLDRARLLLDRLAEEYQCHLGLIAAELAAPLSEQGFRAAMDQGALVARVYPP